MSNAKKRAPRNRTLTLSDEDIAQYSQQLMAIHAPADEDAFMNRVLHQDMQTALPYLPAQFVDLLVLDPPYNLTRAFESSVFQQRSLDEYAAWVDTWLVPLLPLLKPTASVYVCGDWRSSTALDLVLQRHLVVRNRITWERDKGRGALTNWKNNSEDIWFCTVSDNYVFNVEAVKLKRRVIAPYRQPDGAPKDWVDNSAEGRYRLTYPSNLWTDISVPFWSMPENTDHPTQKPEKLIARLLLASSNPGDVVLDPFLGSGTTAVVAKKLDRRFVGIEKELTYSCIACKRLELAENDKSIQGYDGEVFWERNSLQDQKAARNAANSGRTSTLKKKSEAKAAIHKSGMENTTTEKPGDSSKQLSLFEKDTEDA